MLPEKVDQMLSEYRSCIGRCDYLRQLIPELKAEADLWERNIPSELVSIGGQAMDGMPHGQSAGKPTEKFAIMLASGYEPEGLAQLRAQIGAYETELHQKEIVIRFCEAWLKGLTEKERWIIERQVIQQMYWREIVTEYHRVYGEEYSREGLKRIKTNALKKIYQMAR